MRARSAVQSAVFGSVALVALQPLYNESRKPELYGQCFGECSCPLALVYTVAYTAQRVRFEWSQTVWADPRATEFYDPDHSTDEDRFIRVGHSRSERVLLVIFCERYGGKAVRIISARKATPKETKAHEEGI